MSYAGYGGPRWRDDEDRCYGEDDRDRGLRDDAREPRSSGALRHDDDDGRRRYGQGSATGMARRYGLSQRDHAGRSGYPRADSRDYERGDGQGGFSHGDETSEHGGHEHGGMEHHYGRRRDDAHGPWFAGQFHGESSLVGSNYGGLPPDMKHDWRMSDVESHGLRDYRDPDYWKWRNEQLRRLDRDYEAWRQERYKKFAEDFDEWRSRQPGSSGSGPSPASGPSTSLSGASTGSIGTATGMGEMGSPDTPVTRQPKA
jgi:hypothetical protein